MKTDYTSAPATLLIASHCCACGRPLLDAVSVRAGMGPDCADKYGCSDLRGTKEHNRANEVIYLLAAEQKISGWGRISTLLSELVALGFEGVAARIQKRLEPKPTIFLTADVSDKGAPAIRIVAPYNDFATVAWRLIPGREFRTVTEKNDKGEDKKVSFNRVPVTEKRAVLALLKKFYPGDIAKGSKGVFEI